MAYEISTHKFRQLLLPTILIAMALNITSVVDSMFVATFLGQNAQAALQVLEPLILLVTVFEWLFGLGGQILALNRKAEFDNEGSNLYFTVSIISVIIITVILAILCLIGSDTLVVLLHAPKDIIPYVNQYGFYLYISFPIVTTLAVLSQFIRVDGQPNLASALIVIANIVNIILDFVFLGIFHMGIEGASLAMLIGYIIGVLGVLKYHFNPKRSFEFIHSTVPLKKWIKSAGEICKIGIPGASMGIFDVIMVEVMNIILLAVMGNIGLNAFNICTNALLVISILIVGISETLSSIVPVYYSQNDYLNLNHLIKWSFILLLACASVFAALIIIYPDGFLMFFGMNGEKSALPIKTALQIYSISFIPLVFSTVLIFYYEAIERTVVSTIISLISTFLGPLAFTFILYPIMGENGIWLAFTVGIIVSLAIAAVYVKIAERREPEYKGLFFIKKDLIPHTRNYVIKTQNDDSRQEMDQYLVSMSDDKDFCKTVDKLIDDIFKFNDNEEVIMEVLIIDYEDKISVNIKYGGKLNIQENFDKKILDNENIKFTEVLGFNNVEYIIKK